MSKSVQHVPEWGSEGITCEQLLAILPATPVMLPGVFLPVYQSTHHLVLEMD